MRTWIAALAMTIGSFGFQLGLQAGWFNRLTWLAPWAWGLSAALWLLWIITHPKVENEWLQALHVKLGPKIHPIRIALCLVVLLCVSLGIGALVKNPVPPLPPHGQGKETQQQGPSGSTLKIELPPHPPKKSKPKQPIGASSGQVTLPPIQAPSMSQECAPGANCGMSNGQTGGITAGQIIVTPQSPPPIVTFSQTALAAGKQAILQNVPGWSLGGDPDGQEKAILNENNPGTLVSLTIDRAWPNAMFAAFCNVPCKSTGAAMFDGISAIGYAQPQADIVVIGITMPATLSANTPVKWEIRSMSKEPLTITRVVTAVQK